MPAVDSRNKESLAMTLRVLIGESSRAFLSWVVAILMIIPALIIRIADGLSLHFIRRRGGRD